MPSADNQVAPTDETAIAGSIAPRATDPADQRTAIAASLPPPTSAGPVSASEDGILTPGSIFHGDFKISDSIAKKGGMGEVYRATNTINNTIVAIKMIRADLSHDQDLVNKFIQEDEALRQLNNPAVVRYYGVRRDPASGRYYIQMEYIEGPTLGEYIHQHGAVPAPEAKALCRHLALGLEDAHRSGIVHRDLSPDNVLLGNSELARAKIIDFGIAKVASTGDFTTFRTSFVGKYRYASPEHFSASAPIDQRSDIYSLGLVIAAAAAGKPLEMGRDELSGATARLTVPDLSPVPVALRPMLTRMLDPDSTRRPTAAALVIELGDRKEPSGGGSGAQVLLWLGLVAAVMAGGAGGAYYLKQHPEIIASLSGKSGGDNGPTVFRPNGGNGTGPNGTGSNATGSTGLGSTGSTTGGTTATGTGPLKIGPTGSGPTGTGTTGSSGSAVTVYQPTTGPGTSGTTGTSTTETGTPGTGAPGTGSTGTGTTPTGTQVAKLTPGQALQMPDSVRQAISATQTCGTLASALFEQNRVQVAGLFKNEADAEHLKATLTGLGYTLDNQTAASTLACQTVDLLGQLGKVNIPTGANHPLLSSPRTPPVFRAEPTEVDGAFFTNTKHYLYWVMIDGSARTAVVESEVVVSSGSKSKSNPNKAAGWDLALLLVSPRELPLLGALNQATLEQVNIALENEIRKSPSTHDVQSAYQFVRRAG